MTAWYPHAPSRVSAGLQPSGNAPSAPSAVTSVANDSGATVSFLPPAVSGSGPVTSWTVTPYVAGAAQAPVTVSAASAGSLAGSSGGTYVQVPVTGLANGTAYTFTARASNASGTGPESGQSGANTPLSGLVFGDDFNGPAGGAVDPEWYVYNRCGFLGQSEVEYYLPSQVSLDGGGNLLLTALHSSFTGPVYPSGGTGNVTQPWRSGACQSNARTYHPAAGNTMTFEARQQPCSQNGTSDGMWPGLFWLEGQDYKDPWKTDPQQSTWDTGGKAEIDVAEFNPGYNNQEYLASVMCNAPTWDSVLVSGAVDFTAAMNVFSVRWKPGVSVHWFQNGTETRAAATTGVPTSACNFFLLLYLQIKGTPTASPVSCAIDYVRVYDQNLG